MSKKETATPMQKADDSASFYSPEAGRSVQAGNQTEAEQKFEQMTGEKAPKNLTNKKPTL